MTEFATPQSVILFGQDGIRRDDPDFIIAFLAYEILGGHRFTARLMTELREKRGLTYGVSTSLVWMDHAAYIFGQLATSNATVGPDPQKTRRNSCR